MLSRSAHFLPKTHGKLRTMTILVVDLRDFPGSSHDRQPELRGHRPVNEQRTNRHPRYSWTPKCCVWSPSCCEKSAGGSQSMDASLPRPDTVTARAVAEKPNDASLNLPAHSKPTLQRRVDSVSWEVYRDAVVSVLLWLVLFGLVLFMLSMATAQVRPTVPVDRPASFVSSDVSGIGSADGGDHSKTWSPMTPRDRGRSRRSSKATTERYVTTQLRLMPLVPWTWRIR